MASTTPIPTSDTHDAGDAQATAVELEEQDAAIAVPDSGDSGEGGKLKMIVQLLKKCLGVKDLAAMYVQNTHYCFRDIITLTRR